MTRNVQKQFAPHCVTFVASGLLLQSAGNSTLPPPPGRLSWLSKMVPEIRESNAAQLTTSTVGSLRRLERAPFFFYFALEAELLGPPGGPTGLAHLGKNTCKYPMRVDFPIGIRSDMCVLFPTFKIPKPHFKGQNESFAWVWQALVEALF